jgi:hypothetical protein
MLGTVSTIVTTPASVEDWLNSMELSRYWDTFKDNGYDIMGAVAGMNEATLDSLGIKLPGHRNLLLRKAKEIVV